MAAGVASNGAASDRVRHNRADATRQGELRHRAAAAASGGPRWYVQQKCSSWTRGPATTASANYPVGDFFGPVDLGLHLAGRFNSLNIGVGLLAGSILPGSNRLIFTGFSPCWGGFYISSMGGAGLVFDNLGINMLSLVGSGRHAVGPRTSTAATARRSRCSSSRSTSPRVWAVGPAGVYALLDDVHGAVRRRATPRRPRILAVGPGRRVAPISAPSSRRRSTATGALTDVDTWAGRGGFGTKMLQRPRHRRRHLRRHRRRRGLPRPQGGRRVVRGASTRSSSPPRTSRPRPSTASTRSSRPAAPSASTTPRSAARMLSFNYRSIYMRRGRARRAAPALRRRSLPQAVQRGDDRDQAAAHLRRAVRGGVQEDARRVQEGLRALPDHGPAVRHLRPAGGGDGSTTTPTCSGSTRSRSAACCRGSWTACDDGVL